MRLFVSSDFSPPGLGQAAWIKIDWLIDWLINGFIDLSIYLSIYLCIYLSIYLSIYLEEINFKKNYEMVKFFYNSKTISRPPFLSVTPKNINKEQKLSDIFRGFRKTSMDLKWVKLHFNHHLYRWYCCYFLSPSN